MISKIFGSFLCTLNLKGEGIYCFGADPVSVGAHFFVSVHYLLNQSMDFDQNCIYKLLGKGEELIRFL